MSIPSDDGWVLADCVDAEPSGSTKRLTRDASVPEVARAGALPDRFGYAVASEYCPPEPREPFLLTLGAVSLIRSRTGQPLRPKDLALLVYLRLDGRPRSRGVLSALLWGDSPEGKARHSLTQAFGRIRRALGDASLATDAQYVTLRGGLACDAAILVELAARPADRLSDPLLRMYGGEFLEAFAVGAGAQTFQSWADGGRSRFRKLALDVLERQGAAAEVSGRWNEALDIGERSIQIEPFWEHGHRRIMRSWRELGERHHALRHYAGWAACLAADGGDEPDLATQRLFVEMRGR